MLGNPVDTLPAQGEAKHTFNLIIATTLQVPAQSLGLAKRVLAEALQGAQANFGAWPNGDPIVGEASLLGALIPADWPVQKSTTPDKDCLHNHTPEVAI